MAQQQQWIKKLKLVARIKKNIYKFEIKSDELGFAIIYLLRNIGKVSQENKITCL